MTFYVLLSGLSTWLVYILLGLATQYTGLASSYQSASRAMQTKFIAEQLELYFVEHHVFPLSTSDLANTPGYEQVRSMVQQPWQGYSISPMLNDGVWQYQRMVFFSTDPRRGIQSAQYLANNACGTGNFNSSQSWCGSHDSRWFRRETKERYHEQIMTQRVRMYHTLQKFSHYYNAVRNNAPGHFPNKEVDEVTALPAGSMRLLAELANYSGSANNCNGTYTYVGIPIDCGDMYDLWGQPISYQFLSDNHIALTSESPIINSSGTPVIIAAEYDLTLLKH